VRGAEIIVTSPAFSKTVRTDDDGSFAISLPGGDYVVSATADGFAMITTRVRVIEPSASIEMILPVAGSTQVVTIVAADGVGYRTEAINSATKTPTALRDTPQSITVIPTER
jgi:hypothetical protein